MTDSVKLSVIQADRDMAASLLTTSGDTATDFIVAVLAGKEDECRHVQHFAAHRLRATDDLLDALEELRSFVAIMVGIGPDAIIPETIDTPLGVPVKIGAMMRDATATIARHRGTVTQEDQTP